MSDFDYSYYCPGDNCEAFESESKQTVNIYANSEALRPQAEINKEIRRLRKAIAGLSIDTIQMLVAREATLGSPYRFIARFRNFSAALRSRRFVTNTSITSPS